MGSMASGGRGSSISTLLAVLRSLNWLRAFTMYSTRLRENRSTVHSTQIRGFTCTTSPTHETHTCRQQRKQSAQTKGLTPSFSTMPATEDGWQDGLTGSMPQPLASRATPSPSCSTADGRWSHQRAGTKLSALHRHEAREDQLMVTLQAGKRGAKPVTHLCAEAVSHEVKGTVGWNEGDCAVVLKAREPYAPADGTFHSQADICSLRTREHTTQNQTASVPRQHDAENPWLENTDLALQHQV